jgi:hypothetical protein
MSFFWRDKTSSLSTRTPDSAAWAYLFPQKDAVADDGTPWRCNLDNCFIICHVVLDQGHDVQCRFVSRQCVARVLVRIVDVVWALWWCHGTIYVQQLSRWIRRPLQVSSAGLVSALH